jgi:hypothetical protein
VGPHAGGDAVRRAGRDLDPALRRLVRVTVERLWAVWRLREGVGRG